MKLEKREITLNEYDSLKEAFYLGKLLLHEYIECLAKAERKEVKEELIRMMGEVGQDLHFTQKLMEKSAESQIE